MPYAVSLAALLAGASLSSAHMVMKTPTPYGATSLNNSPLDASGNDYPCKQRPGVYEAGGADNKMAVGEQQTLSFTSSAVHGGGSCQLSLTKDKQPTAKSDFRVILNIEGGCPSSAAGNLGENPNGSGASTFQYAIPDGISPGEYTLAWTWFNKIGNREMYMNCAPITVTGSKKRDIENDTMIADPTDSIYEKQDLSSLPEMFKANIQSVSGTCRTADSQDLAFPNPGKNVQKKGSGPTASPTGECEVHRPVAVRRVQVNKPAHRLRHKAPGLLHKVQADRQARPLSRQELAVQLLVRLAPPAVQDPQVLLAQLLLLERLAPRFQLAHLELVDQLDHLHPPAAT